MAAIADAEQEMVAPPGLEGQTAAPGWTGRKHVLDLSDFTVGEMETVFTTADAMQEVLARRIRKVPTLRGRTLVNMFYEASTRTRVSFELAGKYLGAEVVSVSAAGSSVEKGESLLDSMRTLRALGAEVVVVRHPMAGSPYLIAQHVQASVINAGDGWHAHPTQALLDIYTMRRHLGQLRGIKVAIVGDVLHSRVARSNIWGLTIMGAHVVLCGPPTLLPPSLFRECGGGNGLPHNVEVEYSLDRALEGAHVVMALRLQAERQESGLLPSLREYSRLYGLSQERLQRARPGALVMHPGPMNEGVEIQPEVAHGPQSVVQEQVTNGVAIRMALLYLLTAGPGSSR